MTESEDVSGSKSDCEKLIDGEQLMHCEDITVSSRAIDSTLSSVPVATVTAVAAEPGQEESTSVEPALDSSPVDDITSGTVSGDLPCADDKIHSSVLDDEMQHPTQSPARRSIAIQTDAYDSDDESSDDETSSSSDAETDTSSVGSSDSSVSSNVSSPATADHCVGDNNAVCSPPVAEDSGDNPAAHSAVSVEETARASSCIENPALSEKLQDKPSSPRETDFDNTEDKMISPVVKQSSPHNSLVLETAVAEPAGKSVADDASRHEISSPCAISQVCDVAVSSVIASSLSDSSPADHAGMSDADHMSSFKMPGCSPEDVGRFTSDMYQSSCGAYSSPQSNYGGLSSDCSPPACVTLPQNGSHNSLGGYSMPTPSPTNSSARSFNMASPSSYQQLASVTQLDQACYQMESSGYHAATSLPTSVATYQRLLPVENYLQSMPPCHQTMTPPVERANSIDYTGSSLQQHTGYDLGNAGVPQMTSWSSLCMQQPQQGGVNPVEFIRQHAGHGLGMQTSCRSSALDIDKQRRYSSKNCNKNVTSHSLMRTAQHAMPNVAVQPGTNMITGYNVYSSNVADCTGDRHGAQLSPMIDYRSFHQRTALGYPTGYMSDHPHVVVPADVYQYRQQGSVGYSVAAQSNHIHGQSISPSAVAYRYMNGTLVGHNTFDMNAMRH